MSPATRSSQVRAGVEESAMLEWIEVSPEVVVVATPSRAALHDVPSFGADPFCEPMRGAGQPETSHWLFEGAIALAARDFREQRKAVAEASGGPSAALWAYRLTGLFHTTHATRRLLPLIAQRFAASGRRALADWAAHKLTEEAGHDELALRDLQALGYQARELALAVRPARAAAWVQQFEQIAADPDPVACVGYAHALERLALLRGAKEVAAIEAALPAGHNATRCLRVHSGLGSDVSHVRANVAVTAALSAPERRSVVRACYRAARIYFDPALDVVLGEGELQALLAPFCVVPISPAVPPSNNQEQVNV